VDYIPNHKSLDIKLTPITLKKICNHFTLPELFTPHKNIYPSQKYLPLTKIFTPHKNIYPSQKYLPLTLTLSHKGRGN